MTTPAWITDRLPRHSDADPEQLVIVSTHLDPDCWNFMHWSRAAQGNLPWRHTSRWVDHEPELPAPVIVTPDEDPEVAAPEIGDWITDRLPKEADADKDGDVEYYHIRRPNEKYRHYMNWRTLIQFEPILPWRHTEWWTSPTTEPTPAAPEPEPEKAARGFLFYSSVIINGNNNAGIYDYAIATDYTAWHRLVLRGDSQADVPWLQIRPLPQPGEE